MIKKCKAKEKLKYYYLILIIMVFISCSDQTSEFTIGDDFLHSKSNLSMVDTFSVELSTVILDSLISSGSGVMLVGNYNDTVLGKINCSGYFQLGLPTYEDDYVYDDDIYDSITLNLRHSGYLYGDTLQEFNLSVYSVTEEITTDESGYLYNTSKFNYDSTVIGATNFILHEETIDSIVIRIDDEIGQDFFEKLKSNDDLISSSDQFLNYQRGMVIKNNIENCNAILGFNAGESEITLNLHYHRDNGTVTEHFIQFPLYEEEKQFNQIETDFEGSNLENLYEDSDATPANVLNNQSYLQGGIGLFTKIRFPTMPESLLITNLLILKAELVLYPERTSYDKTSLPESLYLYETNKSNKFGSVLYNDYGEYISPTLVVDYMYREDTYYTFDLTSFIRDELEDNYFDVENGILISLPYDELYTTMNNASFTSKDPKPKLLIHYIVY